MILPLNLVNSASKNPNKFEFVLNTLQHQRRLRKHKKGEMDVTNERNQFAELDEIGLFTPGGTFCAPISTSDIGYMLSWQGSPYTRRRQCIYLDGRFVVVAVIASTRTLFQTDIKAKD